MNLTSITWLGHSCFKIENSGYAIVIDPYTEVTGYSEFKTDANEVLCSHGHGDHNYVTAVNIAPANVKSPFTVTKIASFHDDSKGGARGDNLIHLLETGDGLRLAHFGDLGHIPEEETLRALEGLDAVFIPVGGFFTIDSGTAKVIVDILKPRVVFPMHYRLGELGYPVISELSDFLSLCDNIRKYSGNSLELSKETKPQTAVLKYVPS